MRLKGSKCVTDILILKLWTNLRCTYRTSHGLSIYQRRSSQSYHLNRCLLLPSAVYHSLSPPVPRTSIRFLTIITLKAKAYHLFPTKFGDCVMVESGSNISVEERWMVKTRLGLADEKKASLVRFVLCRSRFPSSCAAKL